jgi:hypothetical protein
MFAMSKRLNSGSVDNTFDLIPALNLIGWDKIVMVSEDQKFVDFKANVSGCQINIRIERSRNGFVVHSAEMPYLCFENAGLDSWVAVVELVQQVLSK